MEVVNVSGDVATRKAQEAEARRRLDNDPSIKSVLGFSQGGYLAGRLRGDYPDKEFTVVSASKKIQGNIQLPGGHMQQLGALATQLEQTKAPSSGPLKSAIVLPDNIDRNVLDTTMGNENAKSVEGTGNVKVDVEVKTDYPMHKSPVFKDVKVDRPKQMDPAPEGKKTGTASGASAE